jgi:hypothetical protein
MQRRDPAREDARARAGRAVHALLVGTSPEEDRQAWLAITAEKEAGAARRCGVWALTASEEDLDHWIEGNYPGGLEAWNQNRPNHDPLAMGDSLSVQVALHRRRCTPRSVTGVTATASHASGSGPPRSIRL